MVKLLLITHQSEIAFIWMLRPSFNLLCHAFIPLGLEIIDNQLFAILGQRYSTHIVITILILFVQTLVVLLAQDLMVFHELLECCKINLFSFTLLLHHFATKLAGSWFRSVERH